MTIDWKIYYTDGSEWTNEDGPWEEAFGRGVIGIAYNDKPGVNDVGRRIEWKRDYYIWWPGAEGPWSVDWAGVMDYLIEIKSPHANVPLMALTLSQLESAGVKFGRSVADAEWPALAHKIFNDPDLRVKSAWRPDELAEPSLA